MSKLFLSVLFGLFCLTTTGVTFSDNKKMPVETGDLKDLVTFFAKNFAKEKSEQFRPAKPEHQKIWRALIQAILSQKLDEAQKILRRLPLSFELVRFTDKTTKREYLVLREKSPSPAGWGLYVFDLQTKSDLVLQVPHPIADARTEIEGIDAFRQTRAAVFMMAGTHRRASSVESECNQPGLCSRQKASENEEAKYPISDVAHSVITVFQTTHETIADARPKSVAVQLHGMIERPSCPKAFLSTGTGTPTQNAKRLLDALSKNKVEAEIWRGDCKGCPLIATTNTQGRYSNGEKNAPCTKDAKNSPEPGRFIHIEQEPALRRDADSWQPVIDALKSAFPSEK